MKLFAPRSDWSMAAPRESNWFGMSGSMPTTSGVRVSEDSALCLSAVFAATRVISETLASLPLNTLEQVDARTTTKAINHPLWQILHDAPNPEQDVMTWLDMQVALQVNWGNAYAEIQRDSLGAVVALWPIHPSRIPLRNIRRNGNDPGKIYAGQSGEIVYWVSNDDGSATPIPASDMLHVPGVLSSNGVTGQSIVRWAANSIGIALATEQHAGALFRNGAVTNMAIKSPKIVGRETADRLREQWQKTFGGVSNHYKTLLLEDGMEPVPLTMNAQDAQLILSRQFSVTEIARWYRLPPHLLADLSRSTFSNIEAENLSFVVHSMLPWIVRWEKAMFRQLLSSAEQKRYRFKFNVNGLLRGDSAARAQFYTAMFQMGAFSPNDIRSREDENPIDGGDQYFVPGNNLIPLDKASELAQAQIDAANAPPQQAATPPEEEPEDDGEPTNRLNELRRLQEDLIHQVELRDTRDAELLAVRAHETGQAETLVRQGLRLSIEATVSGLMAREARAAKQAAKRPQTFLTWRDEFYGEFRSKLSDALNTFSPAADRLGFAFDAAVIAGDYVVDSTTALDPLSDLKCDELEAGVDRLTNSWADRPKQIARRIIPERTAACQA